jgi:hypothetical protein
MQNSRRQLRGLKALRDSGLPNACLKFAPCTRPGPWTRRWLYSNFTAQPRNPTPLSQRIRQIRSIQTEMTPQPKPFANSPSATLSAPLSDKGKARTQQGSAAPAQYVLPQRTGEKLTAADLNLESNFLPTVYVRTV